MSGNADAHEEARWERLQAARKRDDTEAEKEALALQEKAAKSKAAFPFWAQHCCAETSLGSFIESQGLSGICLGSRPACCISESPLGFPVSAYGILSMACLGACKRHSRVSSAFLTLLVEDLMVEATSGEGSVPDVFLAARCKAWKPSS